MKAFLLLIFVILTFLVKAQVLSYELIFKFATTSSVSNISENLKKEGFDLLPSNAPDGYILNVWEKNNDSGPSLRFSQIETNDAKETRYVFISYLQYTTLTKSLIDNGYKLMKDVHSSKGIFDSYTLFKIGNSFSFDIYQQTRDSELGPITLYIVHMYYTYNRMKFYDMNF